MQLQEWDIDVHWGLAKLILKMENLHVKKKQEQLFFLSFRNFPFRLHQDIKYVSLVFEHRCDATRPLHFEWRFASDLSRLIMLRVLEDQERKEKCVFVVEKTFVSGTKRWRTDHFLFKTETKRLKSANKGPVWVCVSRYLASSEDDFLSWVLIKVCLFDEKLKLVRHQLYIQFKRTLHLSPSPPQLSHYISSKNMSLALLRHVLCKCELYMLLLCLSKQLTTVLPGQTFL